jgi:LysM repeat protein
MKRISILLVTLAMCAAPALRAQDAATQERLDKLSGRIDDLTAGQEAIKKQINDLSRDLESLREQLGKPNANYASEDELKGLAQAIKDVDQKRMDDADKIHTELLKLRDLLKTPPPPSHSRSAPLPKESATSQQPSGSQSVFPYVIQSGDTLDAIVLAYKQKNIKVTVAQILKANPGLKPERLRVGQKIYIPAPQP